MKQRLLLLAMVLVISTVTPTAQMSKFKALFLFNFAKNNEWPDNSGNSSFIITVVGDDELSTGLQNLD